MVSGCLESTDGVRCERYEFQAPLENFVTQIVDGIRRELTLFQFECGACAVQ